MRVLIAHNRYRSPGGEERHVELLARGLDDAGVDVRLFERDSAELVGSPLRSAAAGLGLAYRPGGGGIGKELREWQPHVVHFHNIWPLLTPAAIRAARRSGAGAVLTAHNYRFACPGGTLLRGGKTHDDCLEGSSLGCAARNPRSNLVESLLYGAAIEAHRRAGMLSRWVDAFIAPSEFMARIMVRSGLPRSRVHCIPHGVPLTGDRPDPRHKHALFTGRLVAEKGVRTLLAAARGCPEVPVVVAGDGPLAGEVAQADSANVAYLGRLGQPDLAEAMADAAFAVVPSEWHDILTFATLEALAAGRPVVATRMGGLPELVDDGVDGLLVPPADPAALAAAMSRLWHAEAECAAMGWRARQIAEERLSLAAQTRRVIGLYERVLRARARPSQPAGSIEVGRR